MRKAYEYSVDRIGQGAGAGPLWAEYLAFLQHARPGTSGHAALFGGGVAGQEDANRIAVVRCACPARPSCNTSYEGRLHTRRSAVQIATCCCAIRSVMCLQ